MRFRSLFIIVIIVLVPRLCFAAGASATLSAPKTVTVGQTFSVGVVVKGMQDADTIRMNGTFPSASIQWVGASPRGNFSAVSPGTTASQTDGTFSFGAFSLGKTTSGTATVAIFTLKAVQPGKAVIRLLQTSRVLSAGTDQLTSEGSVTVEILPKKSAEAAAEGGMALKSSTQPDENAWYSSKDVTVSWNAAAVAGYRVMVGFDQSPQGPADRPAEGNSWSFSVPADGVWYVHVKAIAANGSIISNDFRLQIDTTPPRELVPVTAQDHVPSTIPNVLLFAALDDTSGVAFYRIVIDGTFAATTTANQWPLPALSVGEHRIDVTAYDRAGNATSGSGRVTVVGAPTGLISETRKQWLYLVIVLVLAAIGGYVWGIRQRRKRRGK